MTELQFKDLIKAILDLGFPTAVAIWLLWRDAKWLSYLEMHGREEEKQLARLLNLMEGFLTHTHGSTKTTP